MSAKRNSQKTYQEMMGLSGQHGFTSSSNVDKLRTMEHNYMRNMTEWSLTRFKWVGMPDTVDTRFLERQLFLQGFALFYFDKRFMRYMAVRASEIGQPNVYGNPVSFQTVSMPGYSSIRLNSKNCVPIWSSYTRTVEWDVVRLYAARLAEIDMSLNLVSKAMRVNTVVSAARSQQLSLQNLMRQREEGVDVIYSDETLALDTVQALDLSVNPQTLAGLRDERNQLWNEAMTVLGIGNANQDKKERLVASEVGANNDQVLISRNAALKARRDAADQINRMFELDISVEWDQEEGTL